MFQGQLLRKNNMPIRLFYDDTGVVTTAKEVPVQPSGEDVGGIPGLKPGMKIQFDETGVNYQPEDLRDLQEKLFKGNTFTNPPISASEEVKPTASTPQRGGIRLFGTTSSQPSVQTKTNTVEEEIPYTPTLDNNPYIMKPPLIKTSKPIDQIQPTAKPQEDVWFTPTLTPEEWKKQEEERKSKINTNIIDPVDWM